MRYDHNRKSLELQPGDLVLLSTRSHNALTGYRKHRQRYVGPYAVQSRINENAYRLAGLPPNVPTTQNVRFLVPFRPTPHKFRLRPTPPVNIPDYDDGEFLWEVERILDSRTTRGSFRFLVKWANTPQQQWLPLHCLTHCSDLLRAYFSDRNEQVPIEVQQFIIDSERASRDDALSDQSEQEEESVTSERFAPEDSEDDETTPDPQLNSISNVVKPPDMEPLSLPPLLMFEPAPIEFPVPEFDPVYFP